MYELERDLINEEARTVELSFSSEEPIERFFGVEILDHGKKSIRMDRLNKGAPLLVNHDSDKQVGVLEKAWIGKDKKGRALVRFSKGPEGSQIFTDVVDGIRRNVSVGYLIHRMVLEEENKDQATYRAVDWEPLEISLASIPADMSVGVGRTFETEHEMIIESKQKEKKAMPEEKVEEKVDVEKLKTDTRKAEMARIQEIMSIGESFQQVELARRAVDSGMDVDAFRKEVMATMKKPDPKIVVGEERETLKPWKRFSEFLYAVSFEKTDKRLLNLSRAQSMGTGAAGGYALPDQFRETLLQVTPQEAHVRPRATVIPPGTPPDAKITIPALDQSTAHDVYAGVSVAWIAEGAAKTETSFYLRQVELEPNEVAGFMDVTDKLLRNWDACSTLVERQFRLAVIAAEDNAFLTGTGVGKPLGMLAALNPAVIDIARAGALGVTYADIRGIYARFMMRGGSGVWLASQTTIPQLMAIKDEGSSLIWQPNARDGMPGTIFGYPVIISERVPVLGTRGDLSLVDCSYYLIKDGSGPIFESTNAVRFKENITTFKITWNVDGQPWLNTPVPLEVGVANTVSPFVCLV
jgi:HK97 family phage major capsid protein